MRGQRHLVKCRCVLSQFKGLPDPPNHHFVVFSVIDDNDNVVQKHVQCNNCGIVHKVTDICESKICLAREDLKSALTIEDIKVSLPKNLVDILERNNADLPSYEQAQFALENKLWGEVIVLSQEEESGVKHGKYVRILGETFFKIDTYNREDVV